MCNAKLLIFIRFSCNGQEGRYEASIDISRWISTKFWTLQLQVAKTMFRREFEGQGQNRHITSVYT